VGLIFFCDFWSHDFHDFYDFGGSGPVFFEIEPLKKGARFRPISGHPQTRAYHFWYPMPPQTATKKRHQTAYKAQGSYFLPL
jgi:hypothetical protein